MNRQRTAGGTIDFCFGCTVCGVPSVSEVRRIVITKICSQYHFTASANRVIGSCNFNDDVIVDINCVRFADASATIGVRNLHRIDVRFIRSRMADGDCSIRRISNIRIE